MSETITGTAILADVVSLLQISNYLQIFIAGIILAIGITIILKGLI